MEYAQPEYPVNMFNKGEIALIQDVSLCRMTRIKSNFFSILYKARVRESEFALYMSYKVFDNNCDERKIKC